MDQPLPKKPYQLDIFTAMYGIGLIVSDIRLIEGIETLTFVDGIHTDRPRHYYIYINPNWDLDEVAAWLKTYLDAKNEKLANS